MNSIIRSFSGLLFPIFFIKMLVLKILSKSSVTVIIFHEVFEKDYQKFSKLIQFINKFFGFITPAELELYLKGNAQINGPKFLISFDDGFLSSGKVTNEILDPLSIKAIFFVCSGFIEISEQEVGEFILDRFFLGNRSLDLIVKERYPLSMEQLQDLSDNGHLIGAHTVRHAVLPKLIGDDLKSEILDCQSYLEKSLNKSIDWFAFPFGGIDFIDQNSLNVIGNSFKYCMSGVRGTIQQDSHKLCLPRSSVNLQESFAMQLALLFGATNLIHTKKIKKMESFLTEGNN